MVKILNASFSMDGSLLLVAYMDETKKYSECFDFEVYYLREIYPEFERLGPPRKTGKVRLSTCYWGGPNTKKYFVMVFEDTPNMFFAYKWPYESEFTSHRCSARILAVKMFLSNIMVLTVNEISIHNINHVVSNFVIQTTPPNTRGVYGFGAISMDELRPVIAYPGKKKGQIVVAQYNTYKEKFNKTKIKTHNSDIEAVAICSVHNLVATTCDTGQRIRVYFIETGVKLYELLRGHNPALFFYNTLSFSPDGKYLVADASNMFLVHVYNFEAYHIKCPNQKYAKFGPYKTFQLAYETFGTRFCSVSAYEHLLIACVTGYLYAYFLPTALGQSDCIKIPMRFGYDPARARVAASSLLSVPETSPGSNDDDNNDLNYAELDFSNYIPRPPGADDAASSLAAVPAISPASDVTYAEIDFSRLIRRDKAYKTPVDLMLFPDIRDIISIQNPEYASYYFPERVRDTRELVAAPSSVGLFSENAPKKVRFIDVATFSLDAVPEKPRPVNVAEFSLAVAPEKGRFIDDIAFSSAGVVARARHVDDSASSDVAVPVRAGAIRIATSSSLITAARARKISVSSDTDTDTDVSSSSRITVIARAGDVNVAAPLSAPVTAIDRNADNARSSCVVVPARHIGTASSSTAPARDPHADDDVTSSAAISTRTSGTEIAKSSSGADPARDHDINIAASLPSALTERSRDSVSLGAVPKRARAVNVAASSLTAIPARNRGVNFPASLSDTVPANTLGADNAATSLVSNAVQVRFVDSIVFSSLDFPVAVETRAHDTHFAAASSSGGVPAEARDTEDHNAHVYASLPGAVRARPRDTDGDAFSSEAVPTAACVSQVDVFPTSAIKARAHGTEHAGTSTDTILAGAQNYNVKTSSSEAVPVRLRGDDVSASSSGVFPVTVCDANIAIALPGATLTETGENNAFISGAVVESRGTDVYVPLPSAVSTEAGNADLVHTSSSGANSITVSAADVAVPSSDTVSAKACDADIDSSMTSDFSVNTSSSGAFPVRVRVVKFPVSSFDAVPTGARVADVDKSSSDAIPTRSQGTKLAASSSGAVPTKTRIIYDDDTNDGCGIDVSPSSSVTLSAKSFTIGEGGPIDHPGVTVYIDADGTRDSTRQGE